MPTSLKAPEKPNAALTAGFRRSMRVLLTIAIQVSGKTHSKEDFTEETRTLVVNAHGALISLAASVAAGQIIKLTHKATGEARECRIVYQGTKSEGKLQTGIEFLEPSGAFWRIDFPPDDWVAPEA